PLQSQSGGPVATGHLRGVGSMSEAEGGHARRRRPPSPQAKRLMLVSAIASIGLAVVLGVVFLPILLQLEAQPRDPFYTLAGETAADVTTVTVATASFPRSFQEFGLLLLEDGLRHEGPLRPSIPVGPMSYTDANDDGTLDVGDFLTIQVETGRHYVLLITLQADPGGGGVGRHEWTT
ncbi:MAG: hypothetical protein ACE5JE_07950, partial [Thermoplasmata archaeon]